MLLIAIGTTIDYAAAISGKRNLQTIADAAALGGAQATRLGNATQAGISQVVANIVSANARGMAITTSTTTPTNLSSVTVTLTQELPTRFGAILGVPSTRAVATATARISAGAPLCVASLATTDPKLAYAPSTTLDKAGAITLAALAVDVMLLPNPGLLMLKGAKLTSPGCHVSTNLPRPYSMIGLDTSKLSAKSIQSGGGYVGIIGTNYSSAPLNDSPAAPDPLASIPAPTVPTGCAYANLQVNVSTSLAPGVYCGGLHITGGATVTLTPGVYIIKDGPLMVDSGASASGNGVSFYLTATLPVSPGHFPNVYFGSDTHISLSATAAGEMAGILFFEDRSLPRGGLHAILSNDARTLLGTIYLSRGFLGVASSAPVADQSAYTIIVADALLLYGGPELVLNTNYAASAVPFPKGVGARDAVITLSK